MANNIHGIRIAIDFVHENWKELIEYVGSAQIVAQVLADISTVQNAEEDLANVKFAYYSAC